jgi:hypothetical protein
MKQDVSLFIGNIFVDLFATTQIQKGEFNIIMVEFTDGRKLPFISITLLAENEVWLNTLLPRLKGTVQLYRLLTCN